MLPAAELDLRGATEEALVTGVLAVNGRTFPLRRRTSEVLAILARAYPNFVPLDRLMTGVYGGAPQMPSDAVMRVHVKRLREQLDGSPIEVLSLWGRGYALKIKVEERHAAGN